jgi:ribonuclease HI
MNIILKTGHVPVRWKKAMIFLIYKGKGHRHDPLNYRPISLLNTDYKIFAKIIAERMSDITEKGNLWSNAQGAWRKRRSCTDKVRLLKNIYAHARGNNRDMHAIYIDQKKAFDSVSHEHLFHIMQMYGFPPQLIELIRNTYLQLNAQFITPHGLSPELHIQRGIKQGCPMSPWLYALYLEPLLLELEQSVHMGYQFTPGQQERRITVLGYADDLVILGANRRAIEASWSLLIKYCKANGIELSNDSKEKTAYTYRCRQEADIADIRDRNNKQVPILKADEHYKYLGVYIALDGGWERQTRESTRSLQIQLAHLRRSAFNDEQCVSILNMVLIPSLAYRARVVQFDKRTLRQWDASIASLIRRKGKLNARVAQYKLYRKRAEGGYGLICLTDAFPAEYTHHLFVSGLLSQDIDVQYSCEKQTDRLLREACDSLGKKRGVKFEKNIFAEKEQRTKMANLIQAHKTNGPAFLAPDLKSLCYDEQYHGRIIVENPPDPNNAIRSAWPTLSAKNKQMVKNTLTIVFPVLKPEYQKELGTHQYFVPYAARNISIWTDGSFSQATKTGGLAVLIPKENEPHQNRSIKVPLKKCGCSMDAELHAIWYALCAVPTDNKEVTIYTDSHSSIDAIRTQLNQPTFRKVKRSIRTQYLLDSVCENIEYRKRSRSQTELKFVHAHLMDKGTVKDEEYHRKMEKMTAAYGDRTSYILKMNALADDAATAAAEMPGSEYAPEVNFAEGLYSLRLSSNEPTIEAQHIREEVYERNQAKRAKEYESTHTEQLLIRQHPEIHQEASHLMLKANDSGKHAMRLITRRARMDALQTRKKLYDALEDSRQKGYTSAWLKKIRPNNDSPKCPLGCDDDETMTHIVKCPHTKHLREEGDRMIRQMLAAKYNYHGTHIKWLEGDHCEEQRRLPAELKLQGYISKYMWNQLTKEIAPNEPKQAAKEIQFICAQVLEICWRSRCRKHTYLNMRALQSASVSPMRSRREGIGEG